MQAGGWNWLSGHLAFAIGTFEDSPNGLFDLEKQLMFGFERFRSQLVVEFVRGAISQMHAVRFQWLASFADLFETVIKEAVAQFNQRVKVPEPLWVNSQ